MTCTCYVPGYGGRKVLVVRKHGTTSGLAWDSAQVNVTMLAPTMVGAVLTLSSLDGEDDIFSLVEILLQ